MYLILRFFNQNRDELKYLKNNKVVTVFKNNFRIPFGSDLMCIKTSKG